MTSETLPAAKPEDYRMLIVRGCAGSAGNNRTFLQSTSQDSPSTSCQHHSLRLWGTPGKNLIGGQ